VLVPHTGIGWQAHLGGLIGGVLSGWIFRDRRPRRTADTRPSGQAKAGRPATFAAGKQPAIDPANPRAGLHKQLDDLGL
jgi:hypothetical protein